MEEEWYWIKLPETAIKEAQEAARIYKCTESHFITEAIRFLARLDNFQESPGNASTRIANQLKQARSR